MFADQTLVNPEHIPQAFSIADGILWIAQANTTTGNAWLTAYHHEEDDQWSAGGQMAVYDCHG